MPPSSSAEAFPKPTLTCGEGVSLRLDSILPPAQIKPTPAKPPDPLDRLLADRGLNSTAKALILAMVRNFAWSKDHCWPTDATLAAKVGKSTGHVQRCLLQLERAGWIRRERTEEVPNGRRIWLLWRSAGAQSDQPSARSAPPAPARSERIVIVKERIEPPREDSLPRSRQEPPAVTPSPVKAEALCPPRRRQAVSMAELTTAAAGDPIIARELARLTAPAPPPEPPPQALTTAELLDRLPGRHDLIMATARRLCVEARDEKLATLRAFEAMARAVATQAVPASVLAGCFRQAMGPQAKERGKVLVAAWKRESGRGMG